MPAFCTAGTDTCNGLFVTTALCPIRSISNPRFAGTYASSLKLNPSSLVRTAEDGLRARAAIYHNPYTLLEMEEDAAERSRREPTLEQKLALLRALGNPYAWYDSFGDPDDAQSVTVMQNPPLTERGGPGAAGSQPTDSKSISEPALEELLDEVLRLYKPYVARPDWERVTKFRSEFLREATRRPASRQRVAARLVELKFSLMPGEKIEYNRAPAEQIIRALKNLLK